MIRALLAQARREFGTVALIRECTLVPLFLIVVLVCLDFAGVMFE